jgi:pimeloyl-ACP methyl ester carboxylesterase
LIITGSSLSGVATSSDGAAVHYAVHGARGPFVILLHGWCCSQEFWRFQAERFSNEFRIVTVDFPGHGLSASPRPPRLWSIEGFGCDATAVADALGANKIALIGHSMGGAAALEAALQLGPRCPLVLGVDTFTDVAFYRRRPRAEVESRKQTFADDFPGAMKKMVRKITADHVAPRTVDWIADAMAGAERQVALPVLGALLAWDIEARWPLLRSPVETINSAMLTQSSEQLPLAGLRVHSMDAVGHFPMLEDSGRFNALTSAILKRHGFG